MADKNDYMASVQRRAERLKERQERAASRTFAENMAEGADVLSEFVGGIAKEEVFGIPGLVGDLTPMIAQLGGGPMSVQYANDPTFRQAVDDFQRVRCRGPCSEGRRRVVR